MPLFLGVLYNLALPYWDTLKKKLAEKNISSLTILHAPNLIGHPLGILLLFALGLFILPTDPLFYTSWFGMVAISAVSLTFHIWGLLRTNFFGVQILTRLGFLANTIAAIVLLGERVTLLQSIALGLATIAVFFFAWPKRTEDTAFVWDTGILFVLLSLVIDAFSTILYKTASLHTYSYASFLTGRFVGDLVSWTIVWILGLVVINKLSPVKELGRFMRAPEGRWMVVGSSLSNLLDSWLIYKLAVVTFSMLGTLTIPSAYFWSRITYREKITARMWIGTALSIAAMILFIY